MTRRGWMVAAVLAVAACGERPRDVGENVDPAELYYVPSIIASARKLVDDVQANSGPTYRRDAHAKAHGCVTATFTVRDDLPETLRTGVFVPGREYKAWIRFSNGNAALQADDEKDARGMAIKLMGVEGEKLLPSPPGARPLETQDFLMINHPVFFNRNVAEYEGFIRYQADGSQFGYFFRDANPLDWQLRELVIGSQLLGRISSPLQTQYHSMTAYALGVDAGSDVSPPPYRGAMKYSARSCTRKLPGKVDRSDPDYLRRALAEHLGREEACFEFLVQVQNPDKNMPIEDPTVKWKTADAPFLAVASIRIPPQEFDTPERNRFCEDLSFTPWRGHVDHRPLGGLNRIRKAVYEEIAVYRHARNKRPFTEPRGWCLRLDGTDCPDAADRAALQ